jgi:hypothetical protein
MTGPESGADGKNNAARPFNFSFAQAAASDLLAVTPQMISEYLKPDRNETNQLDAPGVVVFVPAQMQFAPTSTKTTATSHAGESRATYNSP